MKTFINTLTLFVVGTLFILGPTACSTGMTVDKTTLYRDADGDGYGDADNVKKFATSKLSEKKAVDDDGVSYVEDSADCDDENSAINPGVDEIDDDGVDNNCDGKEGSGVEEDPDDDGDGYTVNNGDCDDANSAINPSATETCDDLDNDCDSETDEGCSADDDGDGYTENSGDCDDSNSAINPSATETCDGVDNDCDGLTDADDTSLSDGTTYYPDVDGDEFGDKSSSGKIACSLPSAYVTDNTDCDDSTTLVKPKIVDCSGNTSVGYAGVDNDCDGETDEDDCSDFPIDIGDGPGHGSFFENLRKTDNDADGYCEHDSECSDGTKTGDCDDSDALINPAASEVCDDSKDNDCDGETDEGCSGSTESCGNGSDDDGDGLADCDDSDCSANSACFSATAIWRGANWEWNEGSACQDQDGFNYEYNQLRSYLDVGNNGSSVNTTTGAVSLDFDAHVAFDYGNEDSSYLSQSYAHKSYYSVLAHNKYFIRAYNNYAVVNCTDAEMTSDGLCQTEVTYNTDSLGSSSWLAGKKVVVLLGGFDADFEGPNEQSVEAEDLSVKVALDTATLKSSTEKVTVTITSDFNGQTHDKKDYKNTVYFTILAYDGDYVSMEETSPVAWSWKELTEYETQSTTVDFDASLSGEDGDNIFAALQGWGFDNKTGIEVKRIGASVNISSYDSSSDTATVGMSGGLYNDGGICKDFNWYPTVGIDTVKAPDILDTLVIGCKSDTVCKVSNGEYDDSSIGVDESKVNKVFNESISVTFTN